MQQFLDQFVPGNIMLAINFENFIFNQASKMIAGYQGGNWESKEVDGVRILVIPGNATEHTLFVEMSGNQVTTDKDTASAAFTSLVVNWFWHVYANSMKESEHDLFNTFHHGLRNAVYSDTPAIPFNTDDFYTLTD